jgi:hypothetical protein
MSRLDNLLKTKNLTLIVSLPENNYDFARTAWENGADAIKVHINVFHNASQNVFGTLEENKETFERIIKDSPVPVGIVIGMDTKVAEPLVEEVIKMGFDFISLYGHHTPVNLCNRDDVSNMFALDYSYSIEEIRGIANSFVADILELSVVHSTEYGQRLNGRDLAKYQQISEISKVPTILPTQRLVYPSDIKALVRCNLKGLMIGAIVTGKTLATLSSSVSSFRKEIDQL